MFSTSLEESDAAMLNDHMKTMRAISCHDFTGRTRIQEIGAPTFTCQVVVHILPDLDNSITANAYSGCTQLTTLTFDNRVTYLGDRAFYQCSRLSSLTLPNSLEHIGAYCFAYCEALTSVTIPNSCYSIGTDAFSYCNNLVSVKLPKNLKTLADSFLFCANLDMFTIDEHEWNDYGMHWSIHGNGRPLTDAAYSNVLVATYCNNGSPYSVVAFASTQTKVISIPSSVSFTVTKEDGTMETVMSTVTTLGYTAYRYTYLQGTIVIPDHITTIEQDSLGYLTKVVTSLTISKSVKSIHTLGFCEASVQSFVVSDENTAFGGFSSCVFDKNFEVLMFFPLGSTTTRLILPKNISSFYRNAFSSNCRITEFALPHDAVNAQIPGGVATTFTVNGVAQTYYVGHTLLTKDGTKLIRLAPAWTNSTAGTTENLHYVVPSTVKYIGDASFASCLCGKETSNSQIDLANVVEIESWAFYQTKFKWYAPNINKVTFIDDYAFHGAHIKGLVIPKTMTRLSSNMFSYSALDFLDIAVDHPATIIWNQFVAQCQSLTSCNIPMNIEHIMPGAFYNTRITEITLPECVKTIAANAFSSIPTITQVEIPYGCLYLDRDAFGSCTILAKAILENCNTCADKFAFRSASEIFQPVCVATFYFTEPLDDAPRHLSMHFFVRRALYYLIM